MFMCENGQRNSKMDRRSFLAGSGAALATPAFAQADPWSDIADSARALDQCHALIIRQSGRDLLSEVFRGPSIGRAVPVKSVSKTVVAALTGAALDRGEITSLDAKLGEVAPQLIPRGADPRVAAITIAHLITMQAGLERTSGANYGGWVSSNNWVANALGRAFVAEPGSRMLYSKGSFHVLGAVLSAVSGESLRTLARSRIGEPLGIEIPSWTRDPQGRYLGGNEMSLTLEGMVRFGEMYHQNGVFGSVQVLSADWIKRSFQVRTRSAFSGLNYWYGWFLGAADGVSYALARGYGGQIICVAPSVEMTLALTSNPTRPARSGAYFGDLKNLIERQILPTVRAQMG
jgi:CubicO group peptidase (beta-lactamase class C family)